MSSRLQGLSQAAAQHIVAAAQALDAGRADAAGQHLAAALAAHPQHPEVLRLQAGWLSLRGQHAAAVEAMQRALAQRKQDPLYHNTLGSVLASAGEFDRAVAALRRACELQPGLAIAWYNLGVMLIRCVRHDAAADALRRAVALAPDNALARTQLADMLRVGDRVGEAETEYRRVLAERPWTGMAWWGLADLKTLRFSADDVRGMQQALQDPRAGDDDRIATGFALAKACDDEGRYAEALAALQQANARARQRQVWNAPAHAAMVEAIRAAFAPPPAPAVDAALGREVVFIVGLPRSGSTLVEQILASHSAVEGA
ncbi:MAG TPA: tetratricopeptide repeat protein, partial [Mizugakiibacter sp.]